MPSGRCWVNFIVRYDSAMRRLTLILSDLYLPAEHLPTKAGHDAGIPLALAMPHFEGAHEIAGLRFWNGDACVQLLAADDARGVMLLERCMPGRSLRGESEHAQDVEIARVLRRVWRAPPPQKVFRPLSAMLEYWREEAHARRGVRMALRFVPQSIPWASHNQIAAVRDWLAVSGPRR